MGKLSAQSIEAALLVSGILLALASPCGADEFQDISTLECGVQIRFEANDITCTGYLVLNDGAANGLPPRANGGPHIGICAPADASRLVDLARRGLAALQALARIAMGLI